MKLGVGVPAAGAQRLTAQKLATAIHTAVNDSALRARAVALSGKIRAEDRVARAVEVIEHHAARVRQ